MIGRYLAVGAAALGVLSGCSMPWADGAPPGRSSLSVGNFAPEDSDPGRATYRAVDRMLDAAGSRLSPDSIIIVGTISDIRDIDRSSALGNLIADQARSRLVQRGQTVSELRLRSAIRMDRRQGEMAISRDAGAVRPAGMASEIMTGTYAVSYTQVHVSMKLVSTSSSHIIAAADFNLPRYMNVEALLTARP